MARYAWPTTPQQRWLYNSDESLGDKLASRLIDVGVTELTFVGQTPEQVAPYLERFIVDEARSYVDGRWEMSVLVARP